MSTIMLDADNPERQPIDDVERHAMRLVSNCGLTLMLDTGDEHNAPVYWLSDSGGECVDIGQIVWDTPESLISQWPTIEARIGEIVSEFFASRFQDGAR